MMLLPPCWRAPKNGEMAAHALVYMGVPTTAEHICSAVHGSPIEANGESYEYTAIPSLWLAGRAEIM